MSFISKLFGRQNEKQSVVNPNIAVAENRKLTSMPHKPPTQDLKDNNANSRLIELKDQIVRSIPERSQSSEYYGWSAAEAIAGALIQLYREPNRSKLVQVLDLIDVQSKQLGETHQSVILLQKMYAIVAN
jgi:hypothetical protein